MSNSSVRCDEQIKIRGYRVEPAEIEAALLEHPGIASAAAGLSARQELVTWYASPEAIPEDLLQAFAAEKLPTFMQPSRFVRVDAMPTLANGKIDRRNGAIHLYNDDGDTPAMTYRFLDAWPASWSGFKLDGKGQGTLVEEIELVTECVMKTGY